MNPVCAPREAMTARTIDGSGCFCVTAFIPLNELLKKETVNNTYLYREEQI